MARRNTIGGEILLAAASCFGAWLFYVLVLGVSLGSVNVLVSLLVYGAGLFPVWVGFTVATGGQLLKSAVRLSDSFFYNYSSAVWVGLLNVLVVLFIAAANASYDWPLAVACLHAGFLSVWGYCMLSKWRGVY